MHCPYVYKTELDLPRLSFLIVRSVVAMVAVLLLKAHAAAKSERDQYHPKALSERDEPVDAAPGSRLVEVDEDARVAQRSSA
jgi:hypothetical protein